MYYTIFKSTLCDIILAGNEAGLTHLQFNAGQTNRPLQIPDAWQANHRFFQKIIDQVHAYFNGDLYRFKVTLAPQGTVFQQNVWQALQAIPHGHLATYKEIAQNIGNGKAARAVGSANNRNPIGLIIPCHRVVGTGGALTGYAHGLAIKQWLITHEKRHYACQR